MIQKNQPALIRAWCSYDWANSVYALTISSAIFPVYYNASTRGAFGGDEVQFLGFPIENTVLYSYALSFSFLLIAVLSPLLSGIADYGAMKKRMMRFFTWLGSLSCMGLYFFHGHNIEWGIFACTLASVGYAGSLVFYNSYLPEIATADRFDQVSAWGFGLGYIGSVIQLVGCLVLVMQPSLVGLSSDAEASRLAFLLTGIWWLGFSQIALHWLPASAHPRPADRRHLLTRGFRELMGVIRSLRDLPAIRAYLPAFFCYSTGVQTVMLLAATFGEKELALDASSLILTVLTIQLVAILGAWFFARLSARKGNVFSLQTMVFIWIGICIAAYLTRTAGQFYGLAFAVGLVMGGIQSLSRSTYSKLLPANTPDTASYFSFYDVTEKVSVVLGTLCYGLVEQLTGSMRNSALLLVLFFGAGWWLLRRVGRV